MNRRRVNLFGVFEVIDENGQPLAVKGRQAVVLAFLLVQNRPVSRNMLADALWPNVGRDKQFANLRKVLYRLEQQFGKGYIHRRDNDLALANQAEISVDLWTYEEEDKQLSFSWNSAEYDNDSLTKRIDNLLTLQSSPLLNSFTLAQLGNLDAIIDAKRTALIERQQVWLRRVIKLHFASYEAESKPERLELLERHIGLGLQIDDWDEEFFLARIKLLSLQDKLTQAIEEAQRFEETINNELAIDVSSAFINFVDNLVLQKSTVGIQQDIQPVSSSSQEDITGTNALIGRRELIDNIVKKLMSGRSQLVSLVGIGGAGKTALARAARRRLTNVFIGGTYFIDLTHVQPNEAVSLDAQKLLLANAIVKIAGDQAASTLADAQQRLIKKFSTHSVLLIIDNFEHVLPAATLLNDLITACPQTVILTTSREQLNLRTEHVMYVDGVTCQVAEHADHLAPSDAALLFAEFCGRHGVSFVLDATNIEPVEQIGRLVSGVPLALELLASWIPLFTAEKIAAQLEQSNTITHPILTAHAVDFPQRQQSMLHVVQTSWDQLSSEQQRCLSLLSLYKNTFSLEAATAVDTNAPFHLTTLLSKAMVAIDAPGRFRIHPLIREFAYSKLRDSVEHVATAEQAYATYVLSQFDEAVFCSNVPDQNYVSQLLARHDDLESAFHFAMQHQMVALLCDCVVPMADYWTRYGAYEKWIALLESLIERVDSQDEQTDAATNLHKQLVVRSHLGRLILLETLPPSVPRLPVAELVWRDRQWLDDTNFELVANYFLLLYRRVERKLPTSLAEMQETEAQFGRDMLRVHERAIELGNGSYTAMTFGLLRSSLVDKPPFTVPLIQAAENVLAQVRQMRTGFDALKQIEILLVRLQLERGEWDAVATLTERYPYSAQYESKERVTFLFMLICRAELLEVYADYRGARRLLNLASRLVNRIHPTPIYLLLVPRVRIAVALENVDAVAHYCETLGQFELDVHHPRVATARANGLYFMGRETDALCCFLSAAEHLLPNSNDWEATYLLFSVAQKEELRNRMEQATFVEIVRYCAFGERVASFIRVLAQKTASSEGIEPDFSDQLPSPSDLLRAVIPLLQAEIGVGDD